MHTTSNTLARLMPVLFGFFIMGFCDLVGISTSYAAAEYQLSEPVANFLPSMVFLWFLVFSIPAGLLMNRIGRKYTVVVSMVITVVALLLLAVPGVALLCYVSFALLGIGNTVLQVSLNPLLANVVSERQLTSSLTIGQFVKAISSFLGPIIAGWAALYFGSWHYMFPIFAVITLVSTLWLLAISIKEQAADGQTTRQVSFGTTFALLKDSTLLVFFLGILFLVGVDVGMNTATPKVLMERCGHSLEEAGWGTSLYFLFRTAGAFIGAFILARFSARRYFLLSTLVGVAAMVCLVWLAHSPLTIFVMVSVIGFAMASIFSIIFSLALQHMPSKGNEVSSLMIMGIAGGAVIPPLMGFVSKLMGSQVGSLLVILGCMLYLLVAAWRLRGKPHVG